MKSRLVFSLLLVMGLTAQPLSVLAQTSSSSSYQVNEAFFGAGGDVNSSSSSYQAQGAAGGLGVGEAASANYATFAGFISPADEYLEMVVNQTTVDLGNLSPSATATGSGTFHVRAYINGSYNVITVSSPPTNESGAVLNNMPAAAAPTTGVEEFGINLVDNASPNIGADPSADPSTLFANGIAASGYDTTDNFKYVVGDVIASSGVGRAWGRTNFTISYIADIANTTPAGVYRMDHDLVVIATF